MTTRSSEYKEGQYSHCTIGVFDVAQKEALAKREPKVVRAASSLAQDIFMSIQEITSIPSWNDNKERTEDDVHEAFRLSQKFIDNLE